MGSNCLCSCQLCKRRLTSKSKMIVDATTEKLFQELFPDLPFNLYQFDKICSICLKRFNKFFQFKKLIEKFGKQNEDGYKCGRCNIIELHEHMASSTSALNAVSDTDTVNETNGHITEEPITQEAHFNPEPDEQPSQHEMNELPAQTSKPSEFMFTDLMMDFDDFNDEELSQPLKLTSESVLIDSTPHGCQDDQNAENVPVPSKILKMACDDNIKIVTKPPCTLETTANAEISLNKRKTKKKFSYKSHRFICTNVRSHKCFTCDEVFENRRQLNIHRRLHLEGFNCLVCSIWYKHTHSKIGT